MDRQLTIEKRGETFHLKFHNYMGPWEGHEIERWLKLDEVDPPPDGKSYEDVLSVNQAYLWHEMDRDSELHALITPDRLRPLAEIVQTKEVRVLEGAEYLPAMPRVAHESEASYVEYLEKLHEPVWTRGPRAVFGAFLVRAIPAVLLVFVVLIISRHTGDKRENVELEELFARASQPMPEQTLLAQIWAPDHSHLVRHEVRTVRYCSGNRMILGDGSFIAVDGIDDAMPLLRSAQMSSAALVFDATVHSGQIVVDQITCATEVLARNKRLRRIAQLGPSDSQPPRGASDQVGLFRTLGRVPWMADADDALEANIGKSLSFEGRIVSEQGRRVFRTEGEVGVVLEAPRVTDKLAQFLDVFTDDPGTVEIDVVMREIYPWTNRDDPSRQRKDSRIVGVAEVYSASAQNHHVIGRR